MINIFTVHTQSSPRSIPINLVVKWNKHRSIPISLIVTSRTELLMDKITILFLVLFLGKYSVSGFTNFNSRPKSKMIQIRKFDSSAVNMGIQLDGLEKGLKEMYLKTYSVKCPFLRRKTFDSLDFGGAIINKLTIRGDPTSLFTDLFPTECYDKLDSPSIDKVAELIQNDWSDRPGYYITGNLTTTIYKNDCIFDGPDPDMPVCGLRKFKLTAAQLFVHSESHSELLGPLLIDRFNKTITAYWRISGKLNLPWQPRVKPMTGNTMYIIDARSGLIEKHVEQWDISVLEAFLCTLFPFACSSSLFPFACSSS